jgi:hypothetical protein
LRFEGITVIFEYDAKEAEYKDEYFSEINQKADFI